MKRACALLAATVAIAGGAVGAVGAQTVNWGTTWREATATQKAAFFDSAMTQLQDELQPAPGDSDYAVKAKHALGGCFARETITLERFATIIDDRYRGDRNICRSPVTTIRGEITDFCYPYLRKEMGLAPSPDFPPCS